MIDPSLLADPIGNDTLDAPTPRALVRERLKAQGVQWAEEDELPPQRRPHAAVRTALTTPPPVRFRKHLPEDPVQSLDPHEAFADALEPLTEDQVRMAFTFGESLDDFTVLGVGDFGWAPRRADHALLYGDAYGTLRPSERRTHAPTTAQQATVLWAATVFGLLIGIALAAWSAS